MTNNRGQCVIPDTRYQILSIKDIVADTGDETGYWILDTRYHVCQILETQTSLKWELWQQMQGLYIVLYLM
jgi:hypothetical protein